MDSPAERTAQSVGDLLDVGVMRRIPRPPAVPFDRDDLERRFGLTPAEARLAFAFVAEAMIEAAAAREGLSYETARQYMKRIFKKTGTNNQAQLMKLLITAQGKKLRPANEDN